MFTIFISSCSYNKNVNMNENNSNTDTMNCIQVVREDIVLENGDTHEVYFFETDTSVVTDHCDDCIYCTMQNPEGNPD